MISRTWGRLGLLPRLVISCSAVLAVFYLVLIVGFARFQAAQVSSHVQQRLYSDLTTLASALSNDVIVGDYSGVTKLLREFAQRADVVRVAWTDPRGNEIAVDSAPIAGAAPAWFEVLAELPASAATKAMVVGGTGYGQVSLQLSSTPVLNEIWNLVASGFRLMLLGVGALLLIVLFTVWHGLRPLTRLVSAVGRFGNGEFSVRVAPIGTPEIVAGIHAFNTMAERVSGLVESLRDSEAKNRRLAMIVEQSNDSILTRDLNGTITSWNHGAERLYGWTAEEALGKSGRELHLRGVTDDEWCWPGATAATARASCSSAAARSSRSRSRARSSSRRSRTSTPRATPPAR